MVVGLQAICLSRGKAAHETVDWTRPGRAHLVGIGGSGMRALARVLAQRGWRLTGSDVATGDLTSALPPRTRVYRGHDAKHLPAKLDVLIHSDAIEANNPELLLARLNGVPIRSYFDIAGRLMKGCHGLAIAGTHGKSTTTAMTAAILVDAGLDPTVLCGAAPAGHTDGGRAGQGSTVLVEACEYRRNFLKLHPKHAVILGIEPDHFDCYPTLDDLEHAFGQFAATLPADGLLLAHGDCPTTRRAARKTSCEVETFGLTGSCDWSARPLDSRDGCYRFDLLRHGKLVAQVQLGMPGRHNTLNALAAAALAWRQRIAPGRIAESLSRFPGLARRFEQVAGPPDVTLLDDFAHHPTEITATLETVRQTYPHRRVLCVFQPHQVSRTARLLDELAASLHNGLRWQAENRLWIADIYRAREGTPAPGEVTSADLAARVRRPGLDVARTHEIEQIGHHLANELKPGDVLLTMGAGNIRQVLNQVNDSIRILE